MITPKGFSRKCFLCLFALVLSASLPTMINASLPTMIPLLVTDGIFGANTPVRVKAYQHKNGLAVEFQLTQGFPGGHSTG